MKTLSLGNRKIGGDEPVYIIAEMSANHAHNYNKAVEIIHAAKEAGADCIKLQTYTADTMTLDVDNVYFNITEGTWTGYNLYKLYQEAYTPWEWQADLKKEAEKIGLDFFSTPYDKSSVDFLEEIGVEFYKTASFELVDIPLLKYIASKGKPIVMSTGMGTKEEIQEAVDAIRSEGNDQVCLLKCANAYPAPPETLNLKTLQDLRKNFDCVIGLSDHSHGSLSAVMAVALGAKVIEKHICLKRSDDTPDSSFSMEPAEFKQMVEDVKTAEKALGKVSYDFSEKEKVSRSHRRSIFVSEDIKIGEKITEDNARIVRPAQGLEPKEIENVLGKTAKVDIQKGMPLSWDLIS